MIFFVCETHLHQELRQSFVVLVHTLRQCEATSILP